MSTTSQRYFDGKSIANDENRAHTVSLLLDYAIEKRLCEPGNTKQMETKGWKSAVQDSMTILVTSQASRNHRKTTVKRIPYSGNNSLFDHSSDDFKSIHGSNS